MTEDELQAIEARSADWRGASPCSEDVTLLLAEVRRLWGLIQAAEWCGGYGCQGETRDSCPWCGVDQGDCHEPDCPAFGRSDGSTPDLPPYNVEG